MKFDERKYNSDARFIVRGKWEDKEAGVAAAEHFAAAESLPGWKLDEITTRQHRDSWWWIEIRYRPTDPVE
jgi:hypothetical protein